MAFGYIVWSIVPVIIAVAFSFNAGASRSVWQGFSLQWWVGGGDSLLHNSVYLDALIHSFTLAAFDILLVVPIGVALAFFLSRWHGRSSGPVAFVASLPLVMPELILAVSLFFLFSHVLRVVKLGTGAQTIAQVTFSLPFVIIITRGRLASISKELEEAAVDLGATAFETIRLVMLPLLEPAIVASAIVAFAVSIDDFVVTEYMSASSATQTVPILIYNTARGNATPALNATASVLAICTLLGVGCGGLAYMLLSRRRAMVKPDAA
jgi:spermidine/putrescine transport system permease protein